MGAVWQHFFRSPKVCFGFRDLIFEIDLIFENSSFT